jgi:hypothetical protein
MLLAASVALSLTACSKKDEKPVDTGGTTTTAAGTTTSENAPGTTEKARDDSTDTTATKSSGKKSSNKKSGNITESIAAAANEANTEVTPDEEQCLTDSGEAVGASDPDIIYNEAKMAGAIGGIIVKCLGKPKTADILLAELKSSDEGADLTNTQLKCLRDEIVSADDESVAVLVGTIIYAQSSGDTSALNEFEAALNSVCGTTLKS